MMVHLNTDRDSAYRDVHNALEAAKAAGRIAGHVSFDKCELGNSRSHTTRINVHLEAWCNGGTCGHRWANTGMVGADTSTKAATYDEWGWFLAELFDQHPDAWAGRYRGIEGFHAKAGRTYDPKAVQVYHPLSDGVPA